MTVDKELRRQEYAKAEEYVISVYETSAPPYEQSKIEEMLEHTSALAPHVQLDRMWMERLLQKLAHRRPEIHVPERSPEEWTKLFPRYPTTDDAFVMSLEATEHDKIRETLNKYGLVVVKAFDTEVCEKTIEAMFDEINDLAAERAATAGRPAPTPVNPYKQWTWVDSNWPSERKFLIPRPAFHPQAFENRVAPHVYQLFAALWGEDRLRVSIDNWGATRGSRNLNLNQETTTSSGEDATIELTDKPRWGKGITPHWDYNPWLWVDEVERQGRNPGYQAVVALNEHRPGMGCHYTLPGGTAFMSQWCQEHGCPSNVNMKRTSHRPPETDPIRQHMQEIPLRRGEMIIWTWGQLHATAENVSDKMRLHQYIRFFPAAETGDRFYEEHDRYAPRRVLRNYGKDEAVPSLAALPESLGQLGRRLVGLEEWP
ncbi:Phytanoyl-CoA dioxygenase (PhyH) [Seminavis robusta]|uniref:Phytanoyl-CoA dioxygenase (PhyH) n=1 Tax=Seminavis robusta TaxID=568900 RepID=A0A9N8HFF9_9STRA|nr:Phytanoyl-CoA dioxygenase (PhyH) [Seminavis robusta]|eukprot:Sro522_g159580.1 Phytanoyl-CoA dioxygenase (PhyH) (428) ;mRNA; f:33822-35105